MWQERLASFKQSLESERVWRDLRVSAKDRKTLTRRLVGALKKTAVSAGSDQAFVHDLSEPESEKLRGWMTQATTSVPQQVKATTGASVDDGISISTRMHTDER
jgi:hypothetical protein